MPRSFPSPRSNQPMSLLRTGRGHPIPCSQSQRATSKLLPSSNLSRKINREFQPFQTRLQSISLFISLSPRHQHPPFSLFSPTSPSTVASSTARISPGIELSRYSCSDRPRPIAIHGDAYKQHRKLFDRWTFQILGPDIRPTHQSLGIWLPNLLVQRLRRFIHHGPRGDSTQPHPQTWPGRSLLLVPHRRRPTLRFSHRLRIPRFHRTDGIR